MVPVSSKSASAIVREDGNWSPVGCGEALVYHACSEEGFSGKCCFAWLHVAHLLARATWNMIQAKTRDMIQPKGSSPAEDLNRRFRGSLTTYTQPIHTQFLTMNRPFAKWTEGEVGPTDVKVTSPLPIQLIHLNGWTTLTWKWTSSTVWLQWQQSLNGVPIITWGNLNANRITLGSQLWTLHLFMAAGCLILHQDVFLSYIAVSAMTHFWCLVVVFFNVNWINLSNRLTFIVLALIPQHSSISVPYITL